MLIVKLVYTFLNVPDDLKNKPGLARFSHPADATSVSTVLVVFEQ